MEHREFDAVEPGLPDDPGQCGPDLRPAEQVRVEFDPAGATEVAYSQVPARCAVTREPGSDGDLSAFNPGLSGLEQHRPLIAAGAVDIVQTAGGWGITHFLRVAAFALAHDLPVSPIGTSPIGLLHAATSVPNHLVSELQDLVPPLGVCVDHHVEDSAYVLGDRPGLGISLDEETIAAAGHRLPDPRSGGSHIRPDHAGRRLVPNR